LNRRFSFVCNNQRQIRKCRLVRLAKRIYRHRYLLTLHEFRLANRIRFDYHLFVQYIFNQQWNQLKTYANQFEIKLIDDLPMYVDYDSADVWANSHLFLLDSTTKKARFVSGFPASSGDSTRVILLVDSTVNSQFKSSSFPEN